MSITNNLLSIIKDLSLIVLYLFYKTSLRNIKDILFIKKYHNYVYKFSNVALIK